MDQNISSGYFNYVFFFNIDNLVYKTPGFGQAP